MMHKNLRNVSEMRKEIEKKGWREEVAAWKGNIRERKQMEGNNKKERNNIKKVRPRDDIQKALEKRGKLLKKYQEKSEH